MSAVRDFVPERNNRAELVLLRNAQVRRRNLRTLAAGTRSDRGRWRNASSHPARSSNTGAAYRATPMRLALSDHVPAPGKVSAILSADVRQRVPDTTGAQRVRNAGHTHDHTAKRLAADAFSDHAADDLRLDLKRAQGQRDNGCSPAHARPPGRILDQQRRVVRPGLQSP